MLHHASQFNRVLEQDNEVRLTYEIAQRVVADDAETTALAWSLFAQARPLLDCATDAAAAVETTCQQRVARSLRALAHGEHEATQSAHRALIERLERWDGLGLPEGKQGSDIAISTQVLLLTEQLLEWWESGISDDDITVRLNDEKGRYYSPKFLDVVIKALPELRKI